MASPTPRESCALSTHPRRYIQPPARAAPLSRPRTTRAATRTTERSGAYAGCAALRTADGSSVVAIEIFLSPMQHAESVAGQGFFVNGGKEGEGGSGVCLRRDFCLNCLEERGGDATRGYWRRCEDGIGNGF